jgi:hypothetical protein
VDMFQDQILKALGTLKTIVESLQSWQRKRSTREIMGFSISVNGFFPKDNMSPGYRNSSVQVAMKKRQFITALSESY